MIHADNNNQRIQDPGAKIPADEPAFLLRAQDATAAETVRFWLKRNTAKLRADKKAGTITPEQFAQRKRKLDLVTAHAHRMDDWQPKKTAD